MIKQSISIGEKEAHFNAQAVEGKLINFEDEQYYKISNSLPFFSFGIGGLFTLIMSMTADVIDLDVLNTGLRREGSFGAIYWWMVKFCFAIAGLLSSLLMGWVGYTPDAATQPEGAHYWYAAIYTFFPIQGTLGAMYVMRTYNVTEETANDIRKQLEARKSDN